MYNVCGFLAPRDFTSDVENYVYICIVDVITVMIVLVRIHSGHQIRSAFVRMNAEMIQIHKEIYDTNRIKYGKNHTQFLQISASVSYYVPSWMKCIPRISGEKKTISDRENTHIGDSIVALRAYCVIVEYLSPSNSVHVHWKSSYFYLLGRIIRNSQFSDERWLRIVRLKREDEILIQSGQNIPYSLIV